MAKQFYAQDGEDVILADIFAGKESGTCLEIGALDGVELSITLHFEQKGWSCILIEANPELAEKARSSRGALVFSCAAGRESGTTELLVAKGAEYLSTTNPTDHHISRILHAGATIQRIRVPVMRVDDLLQQAGVSTLDFATIDVEGGELEVLRGFDLHKWRPKVLVVEAFESNIRQYLRTQGYHCFLHAGWNDWFARKGDKTLLTPIRLMTEYKRLARKQIYAWTFGLLPEPIQARLVKFKRRWVPNL